MIKTFLVGKNQWRALFLTTTKLPQLVSYFYTLNHPPQFINVAENGKTGMIAERISKTVNWAHFQFQCNHLLMWYLCLFTPSLRNKFEFYQLLLFMKICLLKKTASILHSKLTFLLPNFLLSRNKKVVENIKVETYQYFGDQ